jgi:cell division protein FtsB
MVIRRRYSNILFTLGLYAVAAAAVSYFVFHAHHGSRGLTSKGSIASVSEKVRADIALLLEEKAAWEARVALVRLEAMDRDVLDELARATLGRTHKNDVIIMGR